MGKIVFIINQGCTSSRCRGSDIADYLGCVCDIPLDEINQDDTVIMVKCFNQDIFSKVNNCWVDIADGTNLSFYTMLRMVNPNANIIVNGPIGARYAKKHLFPNNRIEWVHDAHCNNERLRRPDRKQIINVLYNGHNSGFQCKEEFIDLNKSRRSFSCQFMDLKCVHTAATTREDAISNYMWADICIAFRKTQKRPGLPLAMKNANKLNNAGSFGIPLIAYPEPGLLWNYIRPGLFMPAFNAEHMLGLCHFLSSNPILYNYISRTVWKHAEFSHISNVAKRYERIHYGEHSKSLRRH